MSIPIKCPTCNAPIGVEHSYRICSRIQKALISHKIDCNPLVKVKSCPGKNNHIKSVRTEKSIFKSFGWLWMKKKIKIKTIIKIDYPETGTRSVWEEYENGEVKILEDLCV